MENWLSTTELLMHSEDMADTKNQSRPQPHFLVLMNMWYFVQRVYLGTPSYKEEIKYLILKDWITSFRRQFKHSSRIYGKISESYFCPEQGAVNIHCLYITKKIDEPSSLA